MRATDQRAASRVWTTYPLERIFLPWASAPATGHDLRDRRCSLERSRRQNIRARRPGDSLRQQLREGPAGVHRFLGAVGRPGLLGGGGDQAWPVLPEPEGDRGEPHQRAVARASRIGRTGERIAGPSIPVQCLAGGVPDVEAVPVARVVAIPPPLDEAVHQVPAVERLGGPQTVGEGQRHGRVVGPVAGRQLERAAARHVLQARLRIPGPEFERRSHRVAHRETEEGPEGSVPDAVRGLYWNRRRVSGALRHVGFLIGFDGSWPNVEHAAHRVVRARAQLNEQAGGDGSGASETATAVDEHVEAQPQPVPEGVPRNLPSVLEAPCRRRLPIPDRQVPPLHVAFADLPCEISHLQQVQLVFLDQGCYRGRPPTLDRVEVGVEVPRPGPGHPVGIRLAGTQRDADPAVAVPRGHRCDAEWAVLARLRCRHWNDCAHAEVEPPTRIESHMVQVPSATTTPSCARAVLVSVSSWANAASVRNGVQSEIRSAKR